MKKRAKKLSLNREDIANLGLVSGAIVSTQAVSCRETCTQGTSDATNQTCNAWICAWPTYWGV